MRTFVHQVSDPVTLHCDKENMHLNISKNTEEKPTCGFYPGCLLTNL